LEKEPALIEVLIKMAIRIFWLRLLYYNFN